MRASKSTLFGSSPRVWGAQEGRSDGAPAPRLIPTCVGSTDITHYNSPENSAHPHVCGEHSHQSALVGVCGGSSPRVWGAPRLIRGRGRFLRLIPTCVGSTLCCGCECHFLTAHPHVCGEHRIARGHPRYLRGSSPRVWGAHHQYWCCRRPIRLIPTCVGSTKDRRDTDDAAAAHPHVCGEHCLALRWRRGAGGSSPRVWGAQSHGQLPQRYSRLIPTCVGSTTIRSSRHSRRPAHPHVCGEHSLTSAGARARAGSSPRVWGAQIATQASASRRRLIPTCVGSTAAW